MTTETVYRSTHPDVLAWWESMAESRGRFSARCAEIAEKFPGFTAVTRSVTKGEHLVGITGRDEHHLLLDPPSDAWKLNRGDMAHYTPYRNHKKDPELIELFSGVSWKMVTPPGGMPTEVMVSGRWYSPGMRADDDGAVWYSWGVGQGYIDPDPELREKVLMRMADDPDVDHDVWQPAKLSEFFAAQGN